MRGGGATTQAVGGVRTDVEGDDRAGVCSGPLHVRRGGQLTVPALRGSKEEQDTRLGISFLVGFTAAGSVLET